MTSISQSGPGSPDSTVAAAEAVGLVRSVAAAASAAIAFSAVFVSMIVLATAAIGFVPGTAGAEFLEEDVEIIYEIAGETAGDNFGFVLEQLGDLTGDGVREFLTSSPYYVDSGFSVGKAYLVDGATGAILRTHVGVTANGRFGFRLALVGDFDFDGIDDYAVSAPGDEGSSIIGEVFVYSGDLALVPGAEQLWYHQGLDTGGRLGRGIGTAGDLDDDGHADLMVGVPHADLDGIDSGVVYIFSGRTQEILRVHTGENRDRMGYACRILGELSGDGVSDYLITAPGAGASDRGKAWVIDGATGDPLYSLEPDSPTAVEFGRFFANTPGDMNGDGVPDLFIGDYWDTAHGSRTGHTYLFDGATGTKFSYEISGDSGGDWNGFGGRELGDLDQDGSADFVTNFFNNEETAAPTAGRVVIYSGQTGAVLRTITSIEGTPDGSYGEWLGYDVTGIGDVNGDEIPDLLVSAGLNAEAGSSAGRVYVIAGVWSTTTSAPDSKSDPLLGGAGVSTVLLRSVHPNPSRESASIEFELAEAAEVSLGIFDASGREVVSLVSGSIDAGRHMTGWDGRSWEGREVASGVFYVRLDIGNVSVSRRLVRIQ